MGYRVRLGKVSKKWKEEFNKFTDLVEAEEHLKTITTKTNDSLYAPFFHTELHELGKYIDYKDGENFTPFYNFGLTEEEFVIVSKDGLKSIIDQYRLIVLECYKSEAESLRTLSGLGELLSNIERKEREWDNNFGYCAITGDLDQDKTDITPSWLFEYSIFNLLAIYRSFDWENDYLIYSGW